MEPDTVNALHDFTLEARHLLEEEVSEQLEGIYGWLPDGKLKPAEEYPAISSLEEAAEARRRLEQYLADESAADLKPQQVRQKLVKEAAFTWLNRFVAFKLMEGNGLLKQTVSKGAGSNGFKLWLTEPENNAELEEYEKGDLPQNELGEGPRQRAYRHFLLAQCAKLAKEIRVLFDPDDLASRLFPRSLGWQKLIDSLNNETLNGAWQPGNEETVGWVYQFFNDEEKAEVFRRLYKEKQKIRREDIPAATQLFTPRWMVRYLVHNTLGRFWLELHSDSRLREALEYLVPFEARDSRRAPMRAMDIHVLDPACGTMHFGLVAFDLLVEMYLEELEKAGSAGWPAGPSVNSPDEIPAKILGCNIYGIDIDLRALQLSALALYLKAKSSYPATELQGVNLACADVSSLTDAQIEDFLAETHLGPIAQRAVRALWVELKMASDAGSLLRPEEAIRRIVQEERASYDRDRRDRLPLPELEVTFDRTAEDEAFWEDLENRLFSAFDDFVAFQRQSGLHEEYFVGELDKGFRLLKLLRRRYDVVLCNPPYSGRKNMNKVLHEILSSLYPKKDGDLFSAFIARCQELTKRGGKCGMVTIHSFMFISSYEELRDSIITASRLETLAHLGTRTEFEIANKTAQGFVLFTYTKESAEDRRLICFRLAKEGYGSAKRQAFEAALATLRDGSDDPHLFFCRPSDFGAIPCSPWVYWITPGLRNLFRSLPKLAEVAQPRQGLATADNFRFLRHWWEVGTSEILFECESTNAAKNSGMRWFPYMKGGSFARWYGNQDHAVNWHDDGDEIRNLGIETGKVASRPQNTEVYFRRGITYSYLTVAKFSARLSPGGFIFDVAGSSLFPEDVPLVLAVMNSEFAGYALKLINPTVNFQVGDVARLPVPKCSSPKLAQLVDEAINCAMGENKEDERTYDFTALKAWESGVRDVARRHERLAVIEQELNEEVYRLYGISDEDRTAIEAELAESPATASEENGDESADNDSEETEDAEPRLTQDELARRWVSYAIGIVLGRFELGKPGGLGRGNFQATACDRLRGLVADRGLLVQDEGHPEDITRRVMDALEIMLGSKHAADVVHAATGKEGAAEDVLRAYLQRNFFKEHIQKYRKRPVYWLLQSPRRLYGLWLFHERLTKDTLLRINEDYVKPKTRLLENELKEVRAKLDSQQGGPKNTLRKQRDGIIDTLDDVQEFAKRLEQILKRGYTPHIDDGVLLNMAPLWELIPAWQAEPRKAWKALEDEKYDWSHQAMDHWPDRVKDKCKTNKSYAIAHGLEKVEAASG